MLTKVVLKKKKKKWDSRNSRKIAFKKKGGILEILEILHFKSVHVYIIIYMADI